MRSTHGSTPTPKRTSSSTAYAYPRTGGCQETPSKSPHILPVPSLTRLMTGGEFNPLKDTNKTSHNELLYQEPLQPALEPRPFLNTTAYEPGNFPRATLGYHTPTQAFNELIATTHRHRTLIKSPATILSQRSIASEKTDSNMTKQEINYQQRRRRIRLSKSRLTND